MAEDRSKSHTKDICRKQRGHRHSVRAPRRTGQKQLGKGSIMKEPMLEILSEALSSLFWVRGARGRLSVGRNALSTDWEFQIIRP